MANLYNFASVLQWLEILSGLSDKFKQNLWWCWKFLTQKSLEFRAPYIRLVTETSNPTGVAHGFVSGWSKPDFILLADLA